jgi:hypothetical protein
MLVEMEEQRVRVLQHGAERETPIAADQRQHAGEQKRQQRGARIPHKLVAIELRRVLRAVVPPMVAAVHPAVARAVMMDEIVIDRVHGVGDHEKCEDSQRRRGGCRHGDAALQQRAYHPTNKAFGRR